MSYNINTGAPRAHDGKSSIKLSLAEAVKKISRLRIVSLRLLGVSRKQLDGVIELLERIAMMSDYRTTSYARLEKLGQGVESRRSYEKGSIRRWSKIAEETGVLVVDRRALRHGGHQPNVWQIRWAEIERLIASNATDGTEALSAENSEAATDLSGTSRTGRECQVDTPGGFTARPLTIGRSRSKKNKTDRSLPPFDLSLVNWEQVLAAFARLCRKIRPMSPEDCRAWLRYAVLSQTAYSEDWLIDSIEAVVNAKEASRNPRARLVAVLANKVVEKEWGTREEFFALAARIEIPYEIWRDVTSSRVQPV